MSESVLATEFELKAVDTSERTISGYASVTGNVDAVGDVIEPGAFRRTVAEHAATGFKNLPVYIGHQHASLPVGMPITVAEDAIGLFTKNRIHATTAGNDLLAVARERMAAGQPLGMSIGYKANPSSIKWTTKGGQTVRQIGELDLAELSYTAMPANGSARVLSVKATSDAQWGSQYAAVQRFFDDDVRTTLALVQADELFR
ncbi:MAG TPA: HK97 family phage prohead protease [Chloroflexi bacterium]|jgi:HK97 family phage prohead protease|nr:HK97 family phage prohead protease [Chloroflexota bacterium]HAL28754.1 HK97 family phage prohead protease [Chloroflexota bacterium]